MLMQGAQPSVAMGTRVGVAERANSAFMVDFPGEQINRGDLYARICHNFLIAVLRGSRGSRAAVTKNAGSGFAIQAVFR